MVDNKNLEADFRQIRWAFDEFITRGSYLCLNEIETYFNRLKKASEFSNEATFLRSILEELKYIDTKKGDELLHVLTMDKGNNFSGRSGEKEYYAAEVSTRANFIYLQSLFERLIKRIYKFGFAINNEFQIELTQRLTNIYKRDIRSGRESKELEEVLINSSNADLSNYVDKLDYPPLYNLIDILKLKKGVFKEYIEMSYMLDVYRVTRNAIAHRSGYFDRTFFNELDKINGVKGRLGDQKNKKLRNSLLEILVGKSRFSRLSSPEDLIGRFIHLSHKDFIYCFSNFTQLSLISIGLISKDKELLSKMTETLSGEVVHSLLLEHLKTQSNIPLVIGKKISEDIDNTLILINKAIDNERIIKKQNLDEFVAKDLYLANLIFLYHALDQNTEKIEGDDFNGMIKLNYEMISGPVVKGIVDSVLKNDPFHLLEVLTKLKDDKNYGNFDTWYSVKRFENHSMVKVFLEKYSREKRINNALAFLRRKKKLKN